MELIHYLDSGIVNGHYSHTLDNAVQSVKSSEERRHEYMIMMVREQEIRARGREEGRKKLTNTIFKRLLATGMPEAQARALVLGADEAIDEDCPEIDPRKTPELWSEMMDALARRNRRMAQPMA